MIEIFNMFQFSTIISFLKYNDNFSIIGILLFHMYLILIFFVLGILLVVSLSRFRFSNFNEKMGQVLLNIGFIESIRPIPPVIFACLLYCILMFILHKIRLESLIKRYKTARFLVSLSPFLAFFNIILFIYLYYYAPISDFSLFCAYLFIFFNLIGILSWFIILFIYVYEKNDI